MYPEIFLSTIEAFKHITTAPPGTPDYNPSIPVKDWTDPNAAVRADQDGNVTYTVLVYDASGHPAKGTNGLPYTRTMTISVDRAESLNLLPDGKLVTLPLPGITRMPLDLSKIPNGYRLDWSAIPTPMSAGQVALRNPTADPSDPVSWTKADHDALMALFNALPKG
jgi:hypothetical protein